MVTSAATDKALMKRLKRRRDDGAFETLVRRWDARVLAFLTKASGDREAAKDLRQEVFIRLYRHGATYNPEYSFATWLFQIASNVLSTWQAKEARGLRQLWKFGEEAGRTPLVDPGPGPRELAALDELNGRIEEATKQFTLKERQLLLLRLDLELSYPEIADIMGAPETTVKSRFYATVKRLRSEIQEQEIAESADRRCYQ